MQPANYFFICGAGHSGTTLLLAILDSHSEIAGIKRETCVFHRIKDDAELMTAVAMWPKRYALSGRFIAEKTPVHVCYLERLFRLFPTAKALVMLRDGRDATLSAAKRMNTYRDALHQWTAFNRSALAFVDHPNVCQVRYERLVRQPEAEIRRVCDFLDVSFEPGMLAHQLIERRWYDTEIRPADPAGPLIGDNHKRNRNWQINRPIFDGSGRWRSEMTEEQKRMFKARAGDLLMTLGYADNHDW